MGSPQKNSKLKTLWIPALICFAALGVEIYALVYNIGDLGNPNSRGGRVAVATFESGKNQVRQKTAGTIVWGSPNDGQTLFQQDAIATMPDSQASVRFADNSEMIVDADSLIVFEQADFPKNGGPGRILARLVRGSVRRINAGPMDLYIKFSDDPSAKPFKLSDSQGGAIFKVSFSSNGIEVVVESGGLHVANHELAANEQLIFKNGVVSVAPAARTVSGVQASPVPKLPSPNLMKPTIQIQKVGGSPGKQSFLIRALRDCEVLAIPDALAEPAASNWRVEIHFAWEAVPGATSYLIQVARDPDFKDKVTESNVDATQYEYSTPPPPSAETLYMHVAGVDSRGNVGEFSPLEKVQIRSLSEISGESHENVGTTGTKVAIVPEPTPVPRKKAEHPTPKRRLVSNPREPAPRPTQIFVERPVQPPPAVHQKKAPARVRRKFTPSRPARLEASYSVLYQSRTFKGSLPSNVSSSGFVPSLVRAEYITPSFKIGGSYLFEVANAGSSGPSLQNGKLGVPILKAWALLQELFASGWLKGWTGGIGPYLTNSSQFSWSGSALTAQTQLLFGVLLSAVRETNSMQWRAELGIVGLGGYGVDGSLTARHWLFGRRQIFGELGGQIREMSLETSYGGALGLGVAF